MMTVGELVALLENYPDDAKVFLMEQPSWPFEYSIAGVTQRCEFEDEESDDTREISERGQDVFILEGAQLKYGSKIAFDTGRSW